MPVVSRFHDIPKRAVFADGWGWAVPAIELDELQEIVLKLWPHETHVNQHQRDDDNISNELSHASTSEKFVHTLPTSIG